MSNPTRIGIIGGSYNPPHIAHLVIADRFAEQMQLERTYFVPAYRSPFKLGDDSAEATSTEQRVAMLRLAIERNPTFEVETVEIERGDISYTINTIHYFRERFPEAALFLLVGGDQAAAFTKWKDWQEILSLVQLCIARRPYTIAPEVERAITFHLAIEDETGSQHLDAYRTDARSMKLPVWIDAPILAVSSTEVRERIASGLSVRFLVPRVVEQYIHAHGLYKQL
jgi:nicotinate-nucleotide adenylyltransferase